jgi:hypothetical protein
MGHIECRVYQRPTKTKLKVDCRLVFAHFYDVLGWCELLEPCVGIYGLVSSAGALDVASQMRTHNGTQCTQTLWVLDGVFLPQFAKEVLPATWGWLSKAQRPFFF